MTGISGQPLSLDLQAGVVSVMKLSPGRGNNNGPSEKAAARTDLDALGAKIAQLLECAGSVAMGSSCPF